MKNVKYVTQRYIDWLIHLGRVKFSLLGVILLAIFALCVQIILSLSVIGRIYWIDIARSVVFGLVSAPLVIYFFTLLVERLERSRRELAKTVTDLRNEVSERIATERKLSEALTRLEKNHRDKTNLLATISHELRTPLNGIIGLSRILLDDQISDQQRNYLKTINISAVSLGHIFNDIIDLEKIDTNRIELNRKPTEVYSLLNDISNFAQLMAEEKHLKFIPQFDNQLPEWLYLDRARLSQILWNLISNAVKFTEKGEIKLVVKKQDNNQYLFSLTDTGVGIPDVDQQHIFEMYYQVQQNTNRGSGSGIGLAISKILANLMGGDLWVESEVNQGSTFHLLINAELACSPQQTNVNHIRQLSILLVEDVEVNLLVAKSVLKKLGHLVDVAMNGQQAIQQFEQHYYDLVLLDIQLPDMSGIEVAQYLRHNYQEGIYDFLPPLIAFTANVMQSEQEYQAKGMDGVLRKPLSLTELNQCLQTHFGDESIDFISPPTPNQASEHIDVELVNLIGKVQMRENIALFRKLMPSYLQDLNDSYQTYKQENQQIQALTQQAHKLKGALGSMGLAYLQQIANLIQQSQQPEWQQHLDSWITILNEQWQPQLAELETYLEK